MGHVFYIMHILSVFLFFASMTCLLAGLIKPTIFSYFSRGEVTRKKIASIFVVAIYTFFVLVVITDPSVGKDWPYLLFSFLFDACIACLLAGLIKPTIFSYFFRGEVTRQKVASIFVVAIYTFFVLGVINSPSVGKDWPYLLFSNAFVTSIACLLAGLIKPTIFSYFFGSNPTRKKVAFIFGFATVVFLVLAFLFAPKTNNNKIDKKTIDDQVTVNTDYRNSVLSCFFAVQDQKTKTRHSDITLEKRYRTSVSTPASPTVYAVSRLDPPIVT